MKLNEHHARLVAGAVAKRWIDIGTQETPVHLAWGNLSEGSKDPVRVQSFCRLQRGVVQVKPQRHQGSAPRGTACLRNQPRMCFSYRYGKS